MQTHGGWLLLNECVPFWRTDPAGAVLAALVGGLVYWLTVVRSYRPRR